MPSKQISAPILICQRLCGVGSAGISANKEGSFHVRESNFRSGDIGLQPT